MSETQTTLRVDFVSESAGYGNTFGWYNKVTGQAGVLFANVEADGSNAPLTPGASSVNFTVNTADVGNIQFFLIPAGGDDSRNTAAELNGPLKVIQLSDGTWALAVADANNNLVTSYGQPQIIYGTGANALFTETAKNAGGVDYASSTVGSTQTAATLAGDTADGVTGQIAWEDQAAIKKYGVYSKPGDADYNDAVFNVSILKPPPVANADVKTISEDAGATTINVLANDTDPNAGAVLHVASVNTTGLLGTVSISANGQSVVYTPAASFQALAQGETATETFKYTVVDQFGGQSTATTTVTIIGANDAPVVASALAKSGAEGGSSFTLNLLQGASDVDHGSVLSISGLSTLPPGFSVSGSTLTVSPGNAAYNSLAAGEILATTLTYNVVDQFGASVAQTATITITGTNDAPVVASALSAGGAEGSGAFSIDLLQGASDVDHGAMLSIANLSSLPAGFVRSGSTITVDTNSAAYNALAAGETSTAVLTYKVVDEKGASVNQTATVTITGTNDAPIVATALTKAGSEGTGTFTLNLLQGATDADHGAVLSIASLSVDGLPVGQLPPGFALNGSTLTVDTNSAAFLAMNNGQSVTSVLSYNVVDQHGASVAQSATVTVNGVSDAAPTTTLRVDFVSEAASYENTFGWYNKATGEAHVLFADVEADGYHAPLTPGVSHAEFTVNSADVGNIQYFLVSDGANDSRNTSSELNGPLKVTQLSDGTWAVAIADSSGNVLTSYGQPRILYGQGVNALFTETAKNAGGVDYASSTVGPAQTAATLAGDTADGAIGALAWEDIAATRNWNGTYSRPGDADYNDAVFNVSIVNATPVAHNDAVNISEDAAATTINVLANDTDPGDTLSVVSLFAPTVIGTVSIAPGGQGVVYTPSASFQALAAGETATETFNYAVLDHAGASSTATVTITIVGVNDGPAITSAPTSGAVAEDGVTSASGVIAFTDVDLTDSHSVTATAGGPGYLGTLTPTVTDDSTGDGSGTVGWTYSASNSALQFLAAGQTLTQNYTVTVNDGHGGTSSQVVSITITGQNDGPVITAQDLVGAVTEQVTPAGDLSDSGTISFADADLTDAHLVSATGTPVTSNLGTLTAVLDSDTTGTGAGGQLTWTYTVADSAVEYLAKDETRVESFTITLDDQNGGLVTRQIDVTITGTNDGPVVTAQDLIGAVTEQVTPAGDLSDSGTISFTDVDLNDMHLVSATGTPVTSNLGTLTAVLDSDTTGTGAGGQLTWTYTVADSAVEYLAKDETRVESFTITLDDQNGGLVTRQIDVTITGTNDAPVVTAQDLIGAVTEQVTPAGDLSDSGTIAFTDVDLNDMHLVSATGTPVTSNLGTLTAVLDSDTTGTGAGGQLTWTYTVADSAVEYLAKDQTRVESFTITLDDQNGGLITKQIDVTITGTNDAPVVTAQDLIGAVTEQVTPAGDLSDSGTISFTDVDLTDAHLVSATGTPVTSNLGTLTAVLDSDTTGTGAGGQLTWTYTVADSAVEYLAKDETRVESFTITLDDQNGGLITKQIDVTITGTNDAPVVTAQDLIGAVTEQVTPAGDLSDSGTIAFTDVDLNDMHLVSATGTPVTSNLGTLTAVLDSDTTGTGAGGQLTWTYTVADSAVEYLAKDQTRVESFTITLDDQNGGLITKQIDVTITGTNDAPVAVADVASATEAGGVANGTAGIDPAGNVLTNDTDVDTVDTKTVSAVNNDAGGVGTAVAGSHGSLTLNADGSYSYAVDNDDAAVQALNAPTDTLTDTFNYTVKDSAGAVSSTTLTVTIHGANDAPVAADDSASGNEDTAILTGNVLANDNDVDNALTPSSISAYGQGAHGSVAYNNDGTFTYTPDANFNGSDSFTYTVSDGSLTSTATVNVGVNAVNDAPVNHYTPAGFAGADIDTTLGGWRTTTIAKPLDADGDNVYGTAGYSIVYSAGHAGIATELPSFVSSVVPLNQVFPLGQVTTPQYQHIDLAPAAGPSPPTEFSGVFYGLDAQPNFLSFTLSGSAHFRLGVMVDNTDYAGITPGDLTVTRTVGATLSLTETITNTDQLVDYYFFDIDGQAGDSFVLSGSNRFPIPGSAGVAGITFDLLSEAPSNIAASLAVDEDTNLSIAGLSVSDVDAGSASITTTLSVAHGTLTVDSASGAAVAGSGTGTVTLTGTANQINTTLAAADNVVYRGAQDFNGADALTITTNDHGATGIDPGLTGGPADEQDVDTIAIVVNPVNDAPVAIADIASATEAGGVANGTAGVNPAGNVLTNDTDVDAGDTKIVSAVNSIAGNVGAPVAGSHGSVTINADGGYTYTVNNSDAAVQGLRLSTDTLTDTFNYTVKDAAGAVSSTTLTVTIHGANDAPVAVADTASATEAGGVANGTAGVNPAGNVLTNDTDVDTGDSKTVSAVNGTAGNIGAPVSGTYGSLTLNADGSYSYAVANNQANVQVLQTGQTVTDSFTYTMKDTAGATSSSTLQIAVHGANDAPVAVDDTLFNGTAGFTFNPANGHFYKFFNLSADITTAMSGATAAGGYLATITSAAENAFVANLLGSSGVGWFGVTDAGHEGQWTILGGPEDGTVFWNGNGSANGGQVVAGQYANWRNATEPNNGGGGGAENYAYIQAGGGWNDFNSGGIGYVVEIGGRPQDTFGYSEDAVTSIAASQFLANDTDVDGDTLTVTGVSATSAKGAAVSIAGTTISYNPTGSATLQALNAGQSTTDTFTYTISDGHGGTSSATVTLTVDGKNDAPVAQNDVASGNEDTSITTGNVLANDSDVDNTLTLSSISAFTQSAHGAVVNNGNGTFTYTPVANYNGSDSFTYTITDGALTSTATVNLTVNAVNDAPVVPPQPNLLVNGSFETVVGNRPVGWSNAGSGGDFEIGGVGSFGAIPSDGSRFIELDAGQPPAAADFITQTVSTVAGGVYHLSFDTAVRANTGLATNQFQVLWNGAVIGTAQPTVSSPTATGWNHYNFDVVSTGTGGTVGFREITNDGLGGLIDNVKLERAVPVVENTAAAVTFSVSDIDAGSSPLLVTLGVAHGALSLSSTAGLANVTGNGTGMLSFTGSQAQVNAAMASALSYTPAANYNGSDSVIINVSDQGATGGGPLSSTGELHLSVVSGPDFGGATALTLPEGEGIRALGATVVPVTDPLGNVTITGLPSNLSSFNGGAYTSATGTWVGTAAQFNALSFTAGRHPDPFFVNVFDPDVTPGIYNLTVTATTPAGLQLSSSENFQLTVLDGFAYQTVTYSDNNGFGPQVTSFYVPAGGATIATPAIRGTVTVTDTTVAFHGTPGTSAFEVVNWNVFQPGVSIVGFLAGSFSGLNGFDTTLFSIDAHHVYVNWAGHVSWTTANSDPTFTMGWLFDPVLDPTKLIHVATVDGSGAPVVNDGTLSVADGTEVALVGTIDNTGTIAVNGADAQTAIEIQGHVTLQGGGHIELSQNDQSFIYSGDSEATLTNVDNVISGGGTIGSGSLTFINQGVIIHEGAFALVIDTGNNAFVNSGTLETNGGTIEVDSATTGGGNAVIDGGVLEFMQASDNHVIFSDAHTGILTLDQSQGFTGTIAGFGGGDMIHLLDIDEAADWSFSFAANGDNSGGTLNVSDGVHSASIALLGSYTDDSFNFASNGHGGTMITDGPAAVASGGNSVVTGTAGHDVLVAGTGNQSLTGNGGGDTFVFRDFSGQSTVADFQQGHDVIEFDHAAFADFAAVLAEASQSGADTVIAVAGHGTVTLQGVALTNLHANDFHLV